MARNPYLSQPECGYFLTHFIVNGYPVLGSSAEVAVHLHDEHFMQERKRIWQAEIREYISSHFLGTHPLLGLLDHNMFPGQDSVLTMSPNGTMTVDVGLNFSPVIRGVSYLANLEALHAHIRFLLNEEPGECKTRTADRHAHKILTSVPFVPCLVTIKRSFR
jgi:hypothetical protein